MQITQRTEMRPHARRIQDVLIDTKNGSLASFSKPNSIRFSPGNGGATPFMNIYSWQMCHTTLVQLKKNLTEVLNVNRYQTSFKIPLLNKENQFGIDIEV